MGSWSPDQLCVYCGVNPAGYIPDWYAGPVCMHEGEPTSCWHLGPAACDAKRLTWFANSRIKVLCKSLGQENPLSDPSIAMLVAEMLIQMGKCGNC